MGLSNCLLGCLSCTGWFALLINLLIGSRGVHLLTMNYFLINCGNNKMLESDWFLTFLIYCLIWLVQHQTVRFDPSDY